MLEGFTCSSWNGQLINVSCWGSLLLPGELSVSSGWCACKLFSFRCCCARWALEVVVGARDPSGGGSPMAIKHAKPSAKALLFSAQMRWSWWGWGWGEGGQFDVFLFPLYANIIRMTQQKLLHLRIHLHENLGNSKKKKKNTTDAGLKHPPPPLHKQKRPLFFFFFFLVFFKSLYTAVRTIRSAESAGLSACFQSWDYYPFPKIDIQVMNGTRESQSSHFLGRKTRERERQNKSDQGGAYTWAELSWAEAPSQKRRGNDGARCSKYKQKKKVKGKLRERKWRSYSSIITAPRICWNTGVWGNTWPVVPFLLPLLVITCPGPEPPA